ncbi:SUMF1/EgtB/PvdO family nonheme iron enzyme [Flavivirga sp. 57AJ16]|uniref:formylglycine-generating enzyme family protein n=1 Tax=Flavivirga sp. 57AJ16 TaxID=3025307 RepID=UPI0023670036|nr:SUMF1/EgtB/PvdO family nonheme iron enzyme [Flavivirga sp. 57AJ16]MDD7884408.1 SUMF1/EgtB/PvdO family nonheme iron enzyme [Flavivirga sp. 57AJ16]
MKPKNYLNFSLAICTLFQIEMATAQNFDSYTQTIKGESFSIEMVPVNGGPFIMGASKNDASRNDDEKPQHEVIVDDFWMGKYEITWEQYDAFVYGEFDTEQFKNIKNSNNLGIDAISGATAPYVDMSFNMGKESNPAVNMTQYAAIMYCKWLTLKTGNFYRLPTEAEWEYVCKKGKTEQAPNLNDIGWYTENTSQKYEKTGLKKANSLGIHDLLGNVSEWVMDQYNPNYYKTSPTKNPWNRPTELYPRVVRGGSWKDTKDKLCCTSREPSKQKWKRRDPQIPKSDWWHTNAPFVGFRVVRPKIQPSKEEIKTYWLDAIEDYGLN